MQIPTTTTTTSSISNQLKSISQSTEGKVNRGNYLYFLVPVYVATDHIIYELFLPSARPESQKKMKKSR